MGIDATDSLIQSLLRLGLVTQAQLDECGEVGPRSVLQEKLLALLLRKGYLTTLQKERIEKGEIASLVLGDYLLQYKVASGSFGRVYRGRDPRSGQIVAIKVLRQRWSSDPHAIDLFQREGKVGMSLHHPNIVQILAVDWDRATNQYFMVMEFVEGGNLRQILTSNRKLPVPTAVGYLQGAVAGLSHAYSRGLTHRDIKMSNILISMDRTAKLVDFGLAGMMSSSERESGKNGQVDVDRTIEYAGLEKATGVKPGDTRSDIFFLGCVAYEMLTGQAPLRKPKDRTDRISASRFSQVPQLTREGVDAPASLFHLVSTMMAFNPKQRYQTPYQLLEAVKGVQRDLEAAVDPKSDKHLAQRSIFVVEGDDNLREKLRNKLPKLGYRVRLAKHPASALEQYRQQPYDAVFIDMGTAQREGLEVFEHLQREAERRSRSCAGLLVLCKEQTELKAQIPDRPNVAVLVRPFNLLDLTDKLQQLLPPPPSQ